MRELIEILSEDLDPDDPGQIDREFIRRYAIPATDFLRERYFRSEQEGVENIPREGPVVAVANHSGGPILPDCWVMLSYYWSIFGFDRPGYALVHDVAFRVPYLRNFLIRIGALRASTENAEKVLARGGLLLIFPGGDLDCLRSFRDRNRVDFFDRTGFVKLAMRHSAPIVPIVNVGGHETVVTLFSSRALARWSGLTRLTRIRTVPVSLGLPWGLWIGGWVPFLPLPAKISYKVGKPFHFREDPRLHEDEQAVERAYAAILNSMQDMLDELAGRRRWPLIG